MLTCSDPLEGPRLSRSEEDVTTVGLLSTVKRRRAFIDGAGDVDHDKHEATAWACFLEACVIAICAARWLANGLLGWVLHYGLYIGLLYVVFRELWGPPFTYPVWLERFAPRDDPEHVLLEWQLRIDLREALLQARERQESMV